MKTEFPTHTAKEKIFALIVGVILLLAPIVIIISWGIAFPGSGGVLEFIKKDEPDLRNPQNYRVVSLFAARDASAEDLHRDRHRTKAKVLAIWGVVAIGAVIGPIVAVGAFMPAGSRLSRWSLAILRQGENAQR
jgi:hypothetical protein